MRPLQRSAFLVFGLASLGLAVLGLLLPLVPTTPFLLLAAWCFSKSSARLHLWMQRQPMFGTILRDWEERRAVKRSVKWTATVLLVALITYPILFYGFHPGLKVVAAATAAGVLMFLWSLDDA